MRRTGISLVLALGLFVPALVTNAWEEKKLSDADVATLLVGKWRGEPAKYKGQYRVTTIWNKDQTFSVENDQFAEPSGWLTVRKSAGTWKVEKGDIIIKFKERFDPKKVETVDKVKVISIDESTLKLLSFRPGPEVKELELKKVK